MSILNKIKFSNQLMLMVLIPLVSFLFFSINDILLRYDMTQDMKNLQTLERLSVSISNLVHETQKERGATAGFLGSKGESFNRELFEQKSLTNIKIKELNKILKVFDFSIYDKKIKQEISSSMKQLEQIKSTRDLAVSLNININKALAYYTNMNASFLDTIALIVKLSKNGEIQTLASAYVNLLP